ncbi:hypothetical protein SBADM41S_06706 [Streptomyces badius]
MRLVARTYPRETVSRRILRSEVVLVLALSLGASALWPSISFVGSLTKPGGLKDQAATLNGSYAPGRPWLDLAWQMFGIATALVPVALVAHLLIREGAGLRAIGFDRARPSSDLGRGTLVAAGIGSAGLAFYLVARATGFNLSGVVPESLPDVWWKFPVLILSAIHTPWWRRSSSSGICCAGSGSWAGRRWPPWWPAPYRAGPTTCTRGSAASSATW